MLALRDLQTLFFSPVIFTSVTAWWLYSLSGCAEWRVSAVRCVCVCCMRACVRVCTLKPTPVCTAAISTPGISTCVFHHFPLSLSAPPSLHRTRSVRGYFSFLFSLFSKTDPHLGAMKSPHYAWKCARGEDEGSVSGPLASFLKPP